VRCCGGSILGAAQQLFREQGINNTGMDLLCAAAQVSKRTAYQHFGSKDELIAEYLRRLDVDTMPDVFDRTDLAPRERLLAAFDKPPAFEHDAMPLCPFIAAAVKIADPEHPARTRAREYTRSVAARLTETARGDWCCRSGAARGAAGAAALLDGASARSRTLDADAIPTAAGIAVTLIEHAIPTTDPVRPLAGKGRTSRRRGAQPAVGSAK
jgi:AcrR family transcriptional regulator